MQPRGADAITQNAVLAFLAAGVIRYGILADWENMALTSFDTVRLCVRLAHE